MRISWSPYGRRSLNTRGLAPLLPFEAVVKAIAIRCHQLHCRRREMAATATYRYPTTPKVQSDSRGGRLDRPSHECRNTHVHPLQTLPRVATVQSDFSLPPRFPRSICVRFCRDDGEHYETTRHWGGMRNGHPQAFPRWLPLMLEMMDRTVSRKPPSEAMRRPRPRAD